MKLDLSALSPRHRLAVRRELANRKRDRGHVDATPKQPIYDSTTEAHFAQYVEALAKAECGFFEGRVMIDWDYHPMTFNLARGLTYTPDFGLVLSLGVTRRYVLVEVKGSWKAKNARDSRTRLLVAAERFQMFEWLAVTGGPPKDWVVEWIS